MRSCLCAVAFLLVASQFACKTRDLPAPQSSDQRRVEEAHRLLDEAKRLLAQDRYEEAADAAQNAGSTLRNDADPYLILFEIRRAQGNAPAAALALKQAAELKPSVEPMLMRQLAELYREEGRNQEAIAALVALRDSGRLDVEELNGLALLQARSGDTKSAFKTLDRVLEADPENPETKTVEAETMLIAGKEMLATKLMDRILNEHPDLASARLLRAYYFYARDYLDEANADLARIHGSAASKPEVVSLRARLLVQRHLPEDAERILQEAVDRNPKNVLLLAQLAEAKLELKKLDEADDWVERALALRPGNTIARYVQGRAAEVRGQSGDAIRIYQAVLLEDPALVPAMSRLWPLLRANHDTAEAMAVVERLIYLNQATVSEKASLAEMYLDANSNLTIALKLVEEALKRDPKSARYLQLRAEILKAMHHGKPGILILRGRHR